MNLLNKSYFFLLLFLFLLVGGISIAYPFMLRDDAIQSETWSAFSLKEKRAFLLGFRHASGNTLNSKAAKKGFVVLNFDNNFIDSLDKFYANKDNRNVRIFGAIEIELLKQQKQDSDEIEKKLIYERGLPSFAW
ncbi:MAG: hypothetical protein HC904_13190 [Blastochloris sp.]|nr:hypothetical protein [Blastochloris sp.]